MMPGDKQPFDPRIHLKNDGGDDDDRKPPARSGRSSGAGRRDDNFRGSCTSEDTKEEITDGVQPLAYDDLPLSDTIATTTAAAPAPAPAQDAEEDPDEVLARRLQEEMEREDRLASQNRHRQMEAEDAALARRLMEQGSFRNLGGGASSGGGPDLSALPEEGIGGCSAASGDDNDASLELARRLQREQESGPIGSSDEALARQLFEESLMNLTGGEDLHGYAASGSRGGHRGGRETGARNSSELPAMPGESDEELARRYFQQSMRGFAADRNDSAASSDEALARQLQSQQLRSATSSSRPSAQTRRDPNSASMQDEDEALARRLMEEGLDELRSGQANAIATLSRGSSANVDEDMELARRMQNIGGVGGSGSAAATDGGGRSASSDYDRLARLRQEQEDEILARQFMQDTGDRSRPGIRQVNTPARLAPQAAVTRVNDAGPRPIPPPEPLPPQHGVSPRGSSTRSIPRPAGPPRDGSIHSAIPAPIVDHSPAEMLPGNEVDHNRNTRGSLFNKFKGGRGRRGSGSGGSGSGPLAIPPPPPSPPRGTGSTQSRPGPFPHSISISQLLPIASNNPNEQGRAGGTGNRSTVPHATASSSRPAAVSAGGNSGRKTSSSAPMCCACHKPAPSYLSTLDKKYHPECFRCMGCHDSIDHSSPFAYTVGDDGEKHPLHRKCYAELFGIKCAVCRRSIPTGADGKVSYVKHPFFDKERMCPRHAQSPTPRRCTGCHRFEPEGDGFADLGDAGRCVCMSCCRSVIVDSVDAKPLWDLVIRFFEDILGLTLWGSMRDTPVLVVGFDALNDQLQSAGGAHSGSSQIMTRGLCLSEHQSGRRIPVQRMHYDQGSGKFFADDVEERGFALFQVPDPSKTNPNSSVTAILCLSGLPSDLTASILAHEATHAWIKLHPNFDVRRPIPLQVEEGCCQLMAYLFLQYLDSVKAEEEASSAAEAQASTTKEASGPTDEKLRQYFKFSIETDESEAYGIGYRAAAKAYAAIGIEALLNFVISYRKFPDV